jgi:hypothetical protein
VQRLAFVVVPDLSLAIPDLKHSSCSRIVLQLPEEILIVRVRDLRVADRAA